MVAMAISGEVAGAVAAVQRHVLSLMAVLGMAAMSLLANVVTSPLADVISLLVSAGMSLLVNVVISLLADVISLLDVGVGVGVHQRGDGTMRMSTGGGVRSRPGSAAAVLWRSGAGAHRQAARLPDAGRQAQRHDASGKLQQTKGMDRRNRHTQTEHMRKREE